MKQTNVTHMVKCNSGVWTGATTQHIIHQTMSTYSSSTQQICFCGLCFCVIMWRKNQYNQKSGPAMKW